MDVQTQYDESLSLPNIADKSAVQATRIKIEKEIDGLLRLTIHSGPLESTCYLLPDELASDLQVSLTNLTLPGRESDEAPQTAD